MPNYDYQCLKCGHQFELFQSMSEPAVKICPKCHGKVRRLVSGGSGVIFKGSGFYATDYQKGNHSKKSVKETEKPEVSKTSTKENNGE